MRCFGTGSITSFLTLYMIITKQSHHCFVKNLPTRLQLKKSSLTCVSNAHVLGSATWPVVHTIEAVSCTQPGTRRANLEYFTSWQEDSLKNRDGFVLEFKQKFYLLFALARL